MVEYVITLTEEEFKKCYEFASTSAKTQREHRSGGSLRRSEEQIKKDTLRGKVAEMLNNAEKCLPEGISFIVSDGWRSIQVQERYHNQFKRKLKRENPDWKEGKVARETTRLCPLPSLEKTGHASGGAVDIELCRKGQRLHFNTKKLPFIESIRSDQQKLSKIILKNRKLLFDVLGKAGFINYPEEYWHWSYGDYRWAKELKKKETIYGPIILEC